MQSGVTGHVTLTGDVYPVGDVDLKFAPLRNRVQKYLYPAANKSEFDEKVPQGQRGTCKCVPVDNMEQVMIQLVNSSEESA
jgi:ATP-dependent Lon protease